VCQLVLLKKVDDDDDDDDDGRRVRGENDICNHHTRFLGSKYTKNAFAVEAKSQ